MNLNQEMLLALISRSFPQRIIGRIWMCLRPSFSTLLGTATDVSDRKQHCGELVQLQEHIVKKRGFLQQRDHEERGFGAARNSQICAVGHFDCGNSGQTGDEGRMWSRLFGGTY